LKFIRTLAVFIDLADSVPQALCVLMTAYVQLDGLLITKDAQVVSVMNQILANFAIETEVCKELDTALEAVTHRRLDAVIVDWDGEFDPSRIVRATRKSSPNSNSIIVAMVNRNSETHALVVGANFMIHKPADVDQAKRCIRAAYGSMLENRRRAARVPVDIPVMARIAELGEVKARISDLSVGGLALQCVQPLPVNREMLTQFPLPGTGVIHAAGRIVNANSTGRAGVRFSFMTDEDRTLLESWLAIELAKLEKAEMPTGDSDSIS
jgi:ActR/RegA family two-component response regulator